MTLTMFPTSGAWFRADARALPLADSAADLVVTSPPYYRKRRYTEGEIGWESTPEAYAAVMGECIREWARVLRPHGSMFVNVGDSYVNGSLAGVPLLVEREAVAAGWRVRNRMVWTKDGGMPDPAKNRLTSRHEYVIHLARPGSYYDLFGYSETFGNGANPGDVWRIDQERNTGGHLAPFPADLARRCITLAGPRQVCNRCGEPRRREVRRTYRLNMARPQARRAMELAEQAGLTEAHFDAIRATGISDTGKAQRTHTGFGRNSDEVRRLAGEAKAALGGYFREFTCTIREHAGWTDCGHNAYGSGVVLDPFAGTGTTGRVAVEMGLSVICGDLDPLNMPTGRALEAAS